MHLCTTKASQWPSAARTASATTAVWPRTCTTTPFLMRMPPFFFFFAFRFAAFCLELGLRLDRGGLLLLNGRPLALEVEGVLARLRLLVVLLGHDLAGWRAARSGRVRLAGVEGGEWGWQGEGGLAGRSVQFSTPLRLGDTSWLIGAEVHWLVVDGSEAGNGFQCSAN